jgi:DNA-binding CsgD family transcriptional regulator
VSSSEGRLAEAQDGIDTAMEAVATWPWREAVAYLLFVRAVHAHATGDPTRQASLLRSVGIDEEWIASMANLGGIPLFGATLVAVWADNIDVAAAGCTALQDLPMHWTQPASAWLAGLIDRAAGNDRSALRRFIQAGSNPAFFELFRAHALTDAGHLAHQLNQPDGHSKLEEARHIYSRLGARSYLERIDATPQARHPREFVVRMSERERDILSLLMSGMSYAQIAGELYVTQKTVSYHLGRLYSRAGVTSRHELTQLARSEPSMFVPR